MAFILYLIAAAILLWLVPALVMFFVFGFTFAGSLLFGFLAGAVLTAALEILGLGVRGLRRIAKNGKA